MINIEKRFDELHAAIICLPRTLIVQAIERLAKARAQRQTVFIIGNGGSAALASHLMNDLNKLASVNHQIPFRALAPMDHLSLLTAWANDASYADAAVALLDNFIQPGDVLVVLTTSGLSANVNRAITFAKMRGADVLLLTGTPEHSTREADITIPTCAPTQTEQEDLMSIVCHTLAEALRVQEDHP